MAGRKGVVMSVMRRVRTFVCRGLPEDVCAVCSEPLEPGEEVVWSGARCGYVHEYCVPAIVRSLGEEAEAVWLRSGWSGLFPGKAGGVS